MLITPVFLCTVKGKWSNENIVLLMTYRLSHISQLTGSDSKCVCWWLNRYLSCENWRSHVVQVNAFSCSMLLCNKKWPSVTCHPQMHQTFHVICLTKIEMLHYFSHVMLGSVKIWMELRAPERLQLGGKYAISFGTFNGGCVYLFYTIQYIVL